MPAKFIATYKTFYTTISPAGESPGSAQVVVGSQLSEWEAAGCGGVGSEQPFELPAVFITKYFNIFRKCFEPTFVSRSKYHLSSSGNNNSNNKKEKFIRFIFRPKGCASGVRAGAGTSTQVGGQFFCGVIKWYLKCSFKLLRTLSLTWVNACARGVWGN